jgi:8-oxo-dGTP pyrophosphatase MutT (NUDIX family)
VKQGFSDLAAVRERLQRRLPCFPVRRLDLRPGERAAAVLIPILETGAGEDGVSLLLERRSGNLGNHAGQYAFPGGAVDPGDGSAVETALREAHEETGLGADQVEVIGLLSDVRTPTGFVITPVLGLVSGTLRLRPQRGEVEELVFLPLSRVLADHPFVMVRRRTRGILIHSHALVYGGRVIWGATARMLLALRRLLAPATAFRSGVG